MINPVETQDLFAAAARDKHFEQAPLAYRMRPKTMEDFVGQEHLLGEGKLLKRIIDADKIQSLIFFGPPGIGKTTLAQIIAEKTSANFIRLSAVEAKTADVREVIEEAKKNWNYYHKKTILFVDEIHRFNKAQQDLLLKDIEEGNISFIGATTANPLYSLNSALVSRSRIFEFKPLQMSEMLKMLKKALKDTRGLGDKKVKITDENLKLLVKKSDGDLRQVLNNLELAVNSTLPDSKGIINITEDIITEVVSQKIVAYDENEHYDLISAFIKSMRASKEDDALHYLARMLKSGEDPLFIARRMVVFASEDVGLADAQALQIATSVFRACEVIGLPEARINLEHGVVYLSRAAKSREAYTKGEEAMRRVEDKPNNPVPDHLKNWKISNS
ncbi:MAG: replication-associated recombination protein A [Candidatus Margulisbacteria bacterium]|nr:replication-associated recombination protein A [Candidatus Margulisiibacteriota bacterium]